VEQVHVALFNYVLFSLPAWREKFRFNHWRIDLLS